MVDEPEILTSGLVLTFTISLGGEVHPVDNSVYINRAVPVDTPVAGDKVVVAPGHIDVEPVITAFLPLTDTVSEGSDIQPC